MNCLHKPILMKKIQLHWQILIALILAVFYGILFPTNYCLTEKSFIKLDKSKIPAACIENLKNLEGKLYENQQDFLKATENCLPEDLPGDYQNEILSAAYSNKPVSYVSWMGDLFLRALKMIIIPLIFSSLAAGVASIGSSGEPWPSGIKDFYLLYRYKPDCHSYRIAFREYF